MVRVPLTWLAESVDLAGASAEEVAAALVRVGLEEEGIHGSDVTGPLVVGRVLTLEKETHSNGKTISWCRVDVGPEHNAPAEGDVPAGRGIVCGAHNFGVGDLVVVALPGAVLPGPFPITARKTYGHVSDGMICSARELGIGDDHTGILVLGDEHDPADLVPGRDAITLLGLDERTVEVNVTPDRGYCFSVRGVAREYAHATGRAYRDPALAVSPPPATAGGFRVEVADDAPIRGRVGCDRFVVRVVRGVDATAQSPSWLERRLTQAGMRPISLAVDVTNYVMLELGQPLHAYDLATVAEPIVVRRARPGERLVTLDDVDRELHPEDLLITDSPDGVPGSRVIGLAGVMGGASTEVSEATVDVLLEGAHFDAVSIARTARRHKLGSEASRRFERGVDPQLPPRAVQRAIDLLVRFGGGTVDPEVTDVDEVPPAAPVRMPADFPARIVGLDYSAARVRELLEEIGCAVAADGDDLVVTPPSWRPDLTAPIDLVEEVARLDGYERMPSVLPAAPAGRGLTHAQRVRRSVARALAEQGFTEVLTYPFMGAQRLDELALPDDDRRRRTVRLVNPLNDALPFLRTSLLATLVDAVRVNLGRGATDLALFEIGRAFRADGDGIAPRPGVDDRPSDDELAALDAALPVQERRVAGVLVGHRVPAGWQGQAQPYEWSDAVAAARLVAARTGADVEVAADAHAPWHPGRCARLALPDGTLVGHAGELHPRVLAALELPARTCAFELDLDALVAAGEGRLVAAAPVLVQPVAKEDLAFVVDEALPAGALVATVRAAAGGLLEDARVFDVYRGEQVGAGRKSVAVTVRLRAGDHTLTADEIAGVRAAVVEAVAREHGGTLRA
jgi:phenylalanyl-tRNA synthetase beta chain